MASELVGLTRSSRRRNTSTAVIALASAHRQLLRVARVRLLGLVPLYPRAALHVVLGKDERHRLAAAAFTEEAIRMSVR
jgi:hypothetical protein